MTPEILQNRRYFTPVWELDHAALGPALKPWVLRRTGLSAVYVMLSLVAGALVAWHGVGAHLDLLRVLIYTCLGVTAGFLLLLPLHEWVHALVYRSSGASEVAVRYQWRTLSAYCVADQFVLGGAAFELVCMAPLLMLTPPLALGALLLSGSWALVCTGALLVHLAACSGDVALINWIGLHERERLWTYDDVKAGKSYFFAQHAQP
ncbi:DUF3267 domain-containing protein [Massilia sp. TS11]|uniref:DUF3267 domain-containing protein n=1 Tax=Massilia sp. TS11 TaxID=2908003 RepID=UPI001EDBA420|nr:DUF3267 domain-containing protein [Massilia sp. TS11]MCG2583410.1 DUF3267 domain-containing protein [Massilia sp. TS11]